MTPARAAALIGAAACLAACGNFNTEWLYQGCDSPCVVTVAPVAARQLAPHEPMVVPLSADLPHGLIWEVASGQMPDSLYLNATTGIISGFSPAPGTYSFVIRATADPWVWSVSSDSKCSCYEPGEIDLAFTVEDACESGTDCLHEGPALLAPVCEEAGNCAYEPADGLCPEPLGPGVNWNAESPLTASDVELWTVVGHRELRGSENQGGFTHQLELAPYDSRGTGLQPDRALVERLDYRLPEDWPLPYQKGDDLAVRLPGVNGSFASAMGLSTSDPGRSLIAYRGPLMSQLWDSACPAPLCGAIPEVRHLTCPGQEDQCGTIRPDLVLLATGPSEWVSAGSGQAASLQLEGKPYRLLVDSAYSSTVSTFDLDLCHGIAPMGTRFVLYPESSCPIARIGWAGGSGLLDKPDSYHLLALTDQSLALDGSALTPAPEQWPMDQPFPDLVQLRLHGAGPQPVWRAKLTAIGTYRVYLDAKSPTSGASCVTDILEVKVRPAVGTELRIELAWHTQDWSLEHDESMELLIAPPNYARKLDEQDGWTDAAWADEDWLFSPAHPNPKFWAPPLPGGRQGDLADGWPEIISLTALDRSNKTNRYPVAVRAGADNTQPMLASVAVHVGGTTRYTQGGLLEPGELWVLGHVKVETMDFVDGAP